MRVLVTGAAGALGRDVTAAFDGHEVFACDYNELDVTDREWVLEVIDHVRPDAVVHTAAWTDVDACESDPLRAFAVNAGGVRNVVEAAGRSGAWVCHVSTDYVFDGATDQPYVESDPPNPLSVYGRSKLAGEHEVPAEATLVRTSWLAGRHGRSFVRTVLDRAAAGEELTVVDDQIGCPTFTADLAAMIQRLVTERRAGLFHVTNQGSTSWYGLATDAMQLAGFDTASVRPITTAELDPPRAATRPAHAVLDNAALRRLGIPLLAHYREPLERLVKELVVQ